MKLLAGLGILVIAIGGYWYSHRPLHYPPGILVEADPAQVLLPESTNPIACGEFSLKPLALFSVDARVLHRRNYEFDAGAKLVPTDLALGWGPMSDESVIDRLNVSQSMRFYWYQYKLPPPIPVEQIVSHSSNMHIIPATPEIAARCKSLRAGALIHMSGDLVEATGPGITKWRSSLSRTDTGNGACELFYVEEIDEITPDSNGTERVLARK